MPAHETRRAENATDPNPPKPDQEPTDQPQTRPAPVHTDTQLAAPTEPARPAEPT
jgi:hypothetical protein